MNNLNKFTSSQIRYMIWLSRLSSDGFGVKNIELANAIGYSKPSVHNMLKSLCESGIVAKESFGLAHLTEGGRIISKKYEKCYELLKKKMSELCGDNATTEIAICGILADMTPERIDELCREASQ